MGFVQYMMMLLNNIGIVVDQIMICVIPLTTKLVVFMNTPFWFSMAY